MSDKSGIQWTEATWNPVSGCTRVSAGCDNCYAVKQTYRLEKMGQTKKYGGLTVLNARGDRHFNGVVRCHEESLAIPLGWKKPRRIFVNSMSDLFHKGVPFEFVDKVFAVMALCPQHTFQVLTKRPERMAQYLDNYLSTRLGCAVRELVGRSPLSVSRGGLTEEAVARFDGNDGVLPNVWLGTSCEDQAAADERIPHLAKCPAAVRFLSVEPMIGPVELGTWFHSMMTDAGKCAIGWVIVGGESGPDARPCNIDWIRSVVAQCKSAGVPCFVKQLGKWITGPHDFEGWQGPVDRFLLSDGDKTATWHRPILRMEYAPEIYDNRPANAVAWGLCDPKGGKIEEWPKDVRVRQFPEAAS